MADRREVLNGALRESCCENAMDPGQIPDEPAMISADWITLRARIRASAMITGIRGMFTHSGPHGDKAYQAMLADAEGPSGYQS